MRCQLMLVVFWLWIPTGSQEGQVTSSSLFDVSSTTTTQCSKSIWLQPGNIHRMMIKCEDQENIYEESKDDECTPNCMISYSGDEYHETGRESCETLHVDCGCDECSSTTKAIPDVQQQCNNSTTVAVLGAVVGLLLLLLVTVTSILVWTCWLLKKRGETKFNTEYQMRSSTDHGQLVNPTYEGDDLLHLQPRLPVPAYETIPPHPRDGAKSEFTEQGENGYHVLSREQKANPETITTTRHMETILEDSKEESYSKLELREESGSTKKTSNEGLGEYSKLETVNIGSNVLKDSSLDGNATVDSSDDNSKQTEMKKSVVDFDDNGDALQLENGDVEKGQQEEAKGEPPLITITLDTQNERNDSNTEASTTEDSACA